MEELSALRKQISDINKRRFDAIGRILSTRKYVAAQVYERYKKCGNANCRCARGELHGPYLWIYQKKKDQKVISTTVVKGKEAEVKELAERYEKLLFLRQEIRKADEKINTLLNEFESHFEKEISEYVKR